jgi:hypothetical protein
MANNRRQYGDEFAVRGEGGGRSAFGMSRRIGARGVRWRTVFAQAAGEVQPPGDAAVDHERGLVRVRPALKGTLPQPLVASGQVEG